jgi:RND family efflux transporter MFP subunit
MRRFLSSLLTVVAIFAIVAAFTACGPKPESAKGSSADLPTVQVQTQPAEKKPRAMTEEVAGTIQAKTHATIEARLHGRIISMLVSLGDKVRKGQKIAQLDAGDIAARLEQAQAALAQAERDWKRVSTLLAQQSATQAEFDAAQARRQVAAGAVAEASAMLAYAEITAPFDGVVARKWAQAGDVAMPGKPLLDLDDPSALQMEADVPEAIAPHLKAGAMLTLRVDAVNRELSGTVSELAPAADPASRTFRVKLDLPQTDGLMPGQFARLSVPIGERTSVTVPVAAVVQRGQLEMVFAVADRHARMHLVKTGKRVGDAIEILSGLDAGQPVVLRGADQLTDGQPVEAR